VLAGRISLGSFVILNTYMGMLVWPMIAFGWVVNLTQRGSASLSRINELLHERPSIASPADAVSLGAVRGEIEFRGVTFGPKPWRANRWSSGGPAEKTAPYRRVFGTHLTCGISL
jgi:ABC-type multidrug transport system fused ATPase/permease subunit